MKTENQLLTLSPLCCLVCILALSTFIQLANADGPVEGRSLLIGIEDYTRAARLPGVANDVRLLRDTLIERGGYEVVTVINSARGDELLLTGQSERGSLQRTIEDWLKARVGDETVVLYFSGHGFRDDHNRLYLAAVDCAPQNPEPGGIPIGWLRDQLVQCSAKMKVLVLDACHAGSARTAGSRGINAKDLSDFFQQTKGLVTLASCAGHQQSYLWPAKRQSLFTYWLAQGLCGHADREPLGVITLNELDDFVARKVRNAANTIYSAQQTPKRLQGPGVTEEVILQLQPVSLKRLLDDMAEQMDAVIRLAGIERVGVAPEFTSGKTWHVLGREFGLLATNCPADMVGLLAEKGQGDYRVLSINAVRELLQRRGIAPKDLGTSESRGISIDGSRLQAVIAGRIERLHSGTIALQCKLLELTDGAVLGMAGGTAWLDGSESAMQGTSGRAEPIGDLEGATIPPEIEPAQIDDSADHPLSGPSFPYRVQVRVRGSDERFRDRTGTFHGNEYHVPLQQGEVFRIYVTNGSGQPTFARVLVDGLNTLPEKTQVKGVYVEPRPERLAQAQPVNLAEAMAWGPLRPGKKYAIPGFFLKTGQNAIYDEFKVVDAAHALASESGYTDQVGLITVAFYDLKKKPSEPPEPDGVKGEQGVTRGRRYHTKTDSYEGPYEPGRLRAVVHIHYGQQSPER